MKIQPQRGVNTTLLKYMTDTLSIRLKKLLWLIPKG